MFIDCELRTWYSLLSVLVSFCFLQSFSTESLQAVEGDDWSSVIDGQTKQTLDPRVTNGEALKAEDLQSNPADVPTETGASEQIVSPFASGSQTGGGLYSAETYDFTVENVDKVLDEVRPYLIADGGNVEVVGVKDGVVSLRLQGISPSSGILAFRRFKVTKLPGYPLLTNSLFVSFQVFFFSLFFHSLSIYSLQSQLWNGKHAPQVNVGFVFTSVTSQGLYPYVPRCNGIRWNGLRPDGSRH